VKVTDRDDKLDRAIELLKEPVSIDPGVDMRIMAEIQGIPAPRVWTQRVWAVFEWLKRGRPVRVSPLGGLAFAAGIAAVVLWGRVGPDPIEPRAPSLAAFGASTVQFVIVAPAATEVSLVGDFNDWSASATPMELVADNRLWSVTIPLNAGRYRYAFLVNGDTWLSDPSAPPMRDDEFGRPGSVVTIGET
jgi:hypothetical protein